VVDYQRLMRATLAPFKPKNDFFVIRDIQIGDLDQKLEHVNYYG